MSVSHRNADFLKPNPGMQRTPPERLGSYEYWTEQTVENPKPVLLRRRLPDGQPVMLLDANEDAAFDDGDLGIVSGALRILSHRLLRVKHGQQGVKACFRQGRLLQAGARGPLIHRLADSGILVSCLSQIKLSPCGRRIAFTVCTDAGAETHKGYVRELPIGCALVWDLAEIENIVSLEWLGQDAVLFTLPDAAGRPHQVQALSIIF